jgi:phasin family protein
MAARQTEHDVHRTEREVTRTAADQAARTARSMSDAAERTARSSADTAKRNSELILGSWRSSTDAANRMAERSLEKFSKVFGLTGETARQTLQRSSGNVQTMLETTTILADGLQDLQGEWMQFVQGRVEENLEHFDQILGCRSLQEWLALQTQIARDHFEAFLQSARRTSERSTKVADQAVQKMSETTLAPQ